MMMMGSPSWIYINNDVLEEILLRLPLTSVVRFKTVSKQWRSILESKSFAERRLNVPKSRKILAAYNCKCGDLPSLLPESKLEGDEEIVYLHCDVRRPSMMCDGLLCFPDPEWITILNPSTGKSQRFPSGLRDLMTPESDYHFLGEWVMGFGKDKVTGSYKVVKMLARTEEKQCHVGDVESGEWKKLRLLPYASGFRRESACVNGSIYWIYSRLLQIGIPDSRLLALDLHTQEFRDVSVPDALIMRESQIVNLEGRLAIANTKKVGPCWMLQICSMDVEEEKWSTTYFINLSCLQRELPESVMCMNFTPLAVSKQGNLVFCNQYNTLFKHYPETSETKCLSSDTCVISPYLENLVPLRSESVHPDYEFRTCTRKVQVWEWYDIAFCCLVFVIVGYPTLVSLIRWWNQTKTSIFELVVMLLACVMVFNKRQT